MTTAPQDRREDIVRLLSESPDGLSDGALARALGPDVRPQSVNALCRRMAGAGVVERVGERPIRNRLVPDVEVRPEDVPPAGGTAPVEPRPDDAPPAAESDPADARPDDALPTDDTDPAEARPEDALPTDESVPVDAPPAPDLAAPDRPAQPSRDVLQAWSRTVNVQAAVASWLLERGATIRSATLDGDAPARDIVAHLGGDDVHVEVTGWPPDGARTHPTTIAGDWFAAAARAVAGRRKAHPRARIVIAVPDTRRYRALAADADGCGAEMWFVDPSGDVDTAAEATGVLR